MNVKHKLQRGQLRKKRNEIVFFFDRLNRNLRAVELDRNDSNTRSKRDQPPTTRIRRACISNFDLNRFDSSFERIRFASLLHKENRIYLVREFFKFSTSLIPCWGFFLSWNWIILFFFVATITQILQVISYQCRKDLYFIFLRSYAFNPASKQERYIVSSVLINSVLCIFSVRSSKKYIFVCLYNIEF